MQLQADSINYHTGYQPFRVAARADSMRSLESGAGVADRLRAVAVAELQARDGFLWAAEKFADSADTRWIDAWRRFAAVENRHAQMLLDRMAELGVSLEERQVNNKLINIFTQADSPEFFWYLIFTAEQRGMEVGLKMCDQIEKVDAKSAAVFRQIAEEEVEHIEEAKEQMAGLDIEALKARSKTLKH